MANIPSIDAADFDRSARPADDFFRFVNGTWLAENPIPADEARWGSFYALRVNVQEELKAIFDDLGAGKLMEPEAIAAQVKAFYASAVDMEARNRAGLAPIEPLLRAIDAAEGPEALVRLLARLHRAGIGAWFAPAVLQDEKNVEVMAFHPYQGGLGLPDRDYYLKDDDRSREIRAKYLTYMEGMLARLDGAKGVAVPASAAAEAAAAEIMKIETELAAASMTRVELRDPEPQYNKRTFAEVAALTPHFAWRAYFEELGAAPPEYFIVPQLAFMTAVDRQVGSLPIAAIRQYLRWAVLNDAASLLDEEIERAHFDFYGRTVSGIAEMKPLWRRALLVTSGMLDEAVGQLYVTRHFSPEAKRRVAGIVDNLIRAFRARIEALDWMGPATKEKAFAKLAAFSRKIGYPDAWKDYSALAKLGAGYAENYFTVQAFEFDRQMRKMGGPVDRTEWFMSPQTVNAYYQPPMNEIVFPAAFLQPPFFDPAADDAVNYGAVGQTIGHELTHGFDDEGSQFDADGNLANWWTAEDRARFAEKAERLVAQYDACEILPGLHVNGHLTLGENIADLGGLAVAYDGFVLAQKENALGGAAPAAPGAPFRPAPAADEFTPAQRFFMAYAVTECGVAREEAERLRAQTDPHSPSRFRVNVPVSNFGPFYEAFGVKEGDALWRPPEERVNLW